MRSERMSRVCIVVLEEVEDDEPSSLHSKATPDHISQNRTTFPRIPLRTKR